jgi:hypothetical protein
VDRAVTRPYFLTFTAITATWHPAVSVPPPRVHFYYASLNKTAVLVMAVAVYGTVANPRCFGNHCIFDKFSHRLSRSVDIMYIQLG